MYRNSGGPFRMKNRKYLDVLSSLVCTGIGITFLVSSLKYGDLRSGIPNAGFFPFLGGLILTLLSLIMLISTIKKKEANEKVNIFPEKRYLKKILILLGSLFAYGMVLEYLGFLISTVFFMLIILRFVELLNWRTIIITSLIISSFSYILFQILLKVQLPHSILVRFF
jgi:putative tricarboxylic transport membrane protein